MNCVIIAADSLPRGGNLSVRTSEAAAKPGFLITGTGPAPRLNEEAARVLRGEATAPSDGRSVQSYLTYRLARGLNTRLECHAGESTVTLAAGEGLAPR
jgi:hypothetical protein